ncbi:MAG: SCO family protein [candidate division KSB1 bacterium]|nr:SCO family protein [candidate division KSB1 bacterium]MDZ7365519.1 SCO family protein [candidate division KSB1 bacterium]MDZ7403622.1 SCO family protein [candidate division KSB1 bacterium]
MKLCRSSIYSLSSIFCLLFFTGKTTAQILDSSAQPPMLRGVGIDQKLGAQLPLELTFRDENGQETPLRKYFHEKPVILAFVYYECPMLCTQVLNGLLETLKTLSFDAGKQFDVLVVSFDPSETSKLAAEKKAGYLQQYGRPGAESGWHFLTGDSAAIRRLTEAAGFRYQYDPVTDQFAHASGVIVITPQGKIARYFYGIEYAGRDLRLALVEASENKIGSPVDVLLLYCFHYDPQTGKYGLVIMNVLRVAGIATVLALGTFMIVMFRRDRRENRRSRVEERRSKVDNESTL